MKSLEIYDTTLRDGTQQEGISLTAGDKLVISTLLDELGVAYVEGGWPGANPKGAHRTRSRDRNTRGIRFDTQSGRVSGR